MSRSFRRLMMFTAVLLLVQFGMFVSTTGAFQARSTPSPEGSTLLQSIHPEGIKYLPLDRDIQSAFSGQERWQHFKNRYGDGWNVKWYAGTGTPHIVWGEGIELLPTGELTRGDVEKISRQFISENRDLFMVDDSELVLNPRSINLGRDKEMWFIHFDRVIDGIPVYQSNVFLRFKHGRLVQFGSDSFPDLAVSSRPVLDGHHALELSQTDCGFREGFDEVLSVGELLYFPVQTRIGGVFDYRLVYRTVLRQPDVPHNWHYFTDAHDGTIIARWDYVFYETAGTITGNIYPRTVIDPVTEVPFENLQVDISSASSVFTDLSGAYYSTATGTRTVSAELYGPYINTNNQAGADAADSVDGSGSGLDILWATGNSTMAERCTYYAINDIRNVAMEWINPSWFSQRLPANVNLNDTCNAYYDYTSVNFFLAGDGCNNTGEIADVVYHEWGHGLDDNIGGINDGAASEGWSDICAIVMTESCDIGPYFRTTGAPVREVCTNYTYPEDVGGGVHYEGQIIGSTNWDLLVSLKNKLGDTAGLEKLRELFWQHFYTSENYLDDYDSYLVIDDDDGNLDNYTPNFNEINLAFYQHGLTERVIPSGVVFTHTPLPDTSNTSSAYEVTAVITSNTGTLDTGSLEIRYRAGGALFTALSMTTTGSADEYHAFIPAQSAGTTVDYYLYGEDGEGPGMLPNDAPASFFSFLVGFDQIFFDDMESGTNGWTHAQVATQDDWMNGSPGSNSYDPSSAYSGSSIWGNDLAPSGWNGDYASNVHNYLRSPSIDCTGYNTVHLRYMRWLTVEEGIYDQATIYVNGNQVWQNAQNGNHVDSNWTIHDIDISAYADDTASVVIEFHMESDGGTEFGGWNIDDFKFVGITTTAPTDTLSVSLDAVPASGQVPFDTHFWLEMSNLVDQDRRAAARINVVIGNGSAFSNWKSGWTNLSSFETFTTDWNQSIPALGSVIGNNVFTLLGQDVTPAPFNQPPYSPSGDTATDTAMVTATN